MASKVKRNAEWAKAKRVCRLNRETLRMAKELGMSPRSLMKNIPSKTQPWKAPVHIWMRDLYEARLPARKNAGKEAERHQARLGINQPDTAASHDPVDFEAVPF